MNYLAHLFLSEPEPLSMIGNMAGDFVKGADKLAALPALARRGVRFHRKLDAFTDAHPDAREAAALLRDRWGRWSPVLVDVFFDHFLASDWDRYSQERLRDYLDRFYGTLRAHAPMAGAEIEAAVERIVGDDRMMSYSRLEGIGAALERIGALLGPRDPGLAGAVETLESRREPLRERFHSFFPQAIQFAQALPAELDAAAKEER